jgi:hypothetical protein
MACDCIRVTNEMLLPENAQLRTLFFFDGRRPRLYVETTPISRTRGQKDKKLLVTYCPFCGVKLEEA